MTIFLLASDSQKEAFKNLKKMELHDLRTIIETETMHITVLRVPGGWMYTHYSINRRNEPVQSSVLAPYRTHL